MTGEANGPLVSYLARSPGSECTADLSGLLVFMITSAVITARGAIKR